MLSFTKRNILLTGKAGTGKTTFLKHIRSTTLKTTMIAAPTGVAAINANGSTIHSLFSLPFHPFVPAPQARHHFISALKLSKERKELFQSLELLIIDEVSMVRCDILDAISDVIQGLSLVSHCK